MSVKTIRSRTIITVANQNYTSGMPKGQSSSMVNHIEPGLWAFQANAAGNVILTTDCGGSLTKALTDGDIIMFNSQDVMFVPAVAGHMVLTKSLFAESDGPNFPIAVSASLA